MEDTSRERNLDRILAEYMQAVDAGHAPPPEDFLNRYPDFAPELRDFFQDQKCLAGFRDQSADTLNKSVPSSGKVDARDQTRVIDGSSSKKVVRQGVHPQLFGDYELVERIAQGGMGVIFKARQMSVNRVVALKMILGGAFSDPSDKARFLVEAEAASSLDHPNIIPIYEIGQRDDQPYFTMKYVAGGSLIDQMPRMRQDFVLAANLLAQVARAVHHAHTRGIVHRDLKPSNVLVGTADNSATTSVGKAINVPSLVPYVTDFGLAKFTQRNTDLTQTGAVLGTPDYMSPEQAAANKELTSASDIFSIGSVLYHVLTGRKPFSGENHLEVLMQVQFLDPIPLRSVDPRIPHALETICLKCLEKSPANRYATALAVAEDLERFIAGEEIRARPVPIVRRLARTLKRYPRTMATVAGLLLLSFVGIIAYQAAIRKVPGNSAPDHSERTALLRPFGEVLQSDQRSRSLQLLADIPTDLRSWDWYHLDRIVRGRVAAFPTSTNTVPAFAINADGSRALTSGDRNGIDLWNLIDGKKTELLGHEGKVRRVAFDPTGAWAASLDDRGSVFLWNLDEQTVTQRFTVGRRDGDLAFSEDGRSLIVGVGGIQVFDLGSNQTRVLGDKALNYDKIQILPTNKLVMASARSKSLVILDLVSGEVKQQSEITGYFQCVSPDGRMLAYANGKKVIVTDLTSQRPMREFDLQETAMALAFVGEEVRIIDFERRVLALDIKSGTVRPLFGGDHVAMPLANAAFSRDLQHGVCATLVERNLITWTVFDEPARFVMPLHASPIKAMAAAPHRMFGSGDKDGTLLLWKPFVLESKQKFETGLEISALVFHDGLVVLGHADGTVQYLDPADGSKSRKTELGSALSCMCSLAQGIAAGTEDGTIHILGSDKPARLSGHRGIVTALAAWSEDRFASAGKDGTVRIWSSSAAQGGEVVFRQEAAIQSLTSHPATDRVAISDANGTVRVFVVGKAQAQWEVVQQGVVSVLFSHDGQRLFCGLADGTVRVLDAVSGTQTIVLSADGEPSAPLVLSRDGRILGSGARTGRVTLWTGPSK